MSNVKRIDELDYVEQVRYKRWVQRRDLGERRARVAEKQAKVLKEEKDSRPFPNNKRPVSQ